MYNQPKFKFGDRVKPKFYSDFVIKEICLLEDYTKTEIFWYGTDDTRKRYQEEEIELYVEPPKKKILKAFLIKTFCSVIIEYHENEEEAINGIKISDPVCRYLGPAIGIPDQEVCGE